MNLFVSAATSKGKIRNENQDVIFAGDKILSDEENYINNLTISSNLGIIFPFLIAAFLKTAQGSSTISIITTSSIVFPLLPAMGLDSELGKVWVIMSLGVGSMTISHANDSYFWVVSQMGNIDVKKAYKTHTVGTFIQGIFGLLLVIIFYNIWSVF